MLGKVSTVQGFSFLICEIQIKMTTYWEDEAWTAVKVFDMKVSSESAVSKKAVSVQEVNLCYMDKDE